jgi:hypothetical protein
MGIKPGYRRHRWRGYNDIWMHVRTTELSGLTGKGSDIGMGWSHRTGSHQTARLLSRLMQYVTRALLESTWTNQLSFGNILC